MVLHHGYISKLVASLHTQIEREREIAQKTNFYLCCELFTFNDFQVLGNEKLNCLLPKVFCNSIYLGETKVA